MNSDFAREGEYAGTIVDGYRGSEAEFNVPGQIPNAAAGAAGMLTVFVRAVMCNWMVSTGVVAAIALEALVNALKRHEGSKGIQEWGARALSIITYESQPLREALLVAARHAATSCSHPRASTHNTPLLSAGATSTIRRVR